MFAVALRDGFYSSGRPIALSLGPPLHTQWNGCAVRGPSALAVFAHRPLNLTRARAHCSSLDSAYSCSKASMTSSIARFL